MDIRLRTRELDGMVIVEVGGELDLHNAPQVRTELARLCEEEKPRVLADLSGLSFIDSTGIGVLVGAHKRARERGGRILFVCPTPRIRRVFEIAGLVRALPLYSSREEALAQSSEALTGTPSTSSASNLGIPSTTPSPASATPEVAADAATSGATVRDLNVPATS
ncbi:MAG: anti-sigma factor antagonist [Abditibacteriota bacterium]|jgi:anti-sigma B factor antagonist|nr:anti-sigma factor antagonist [Abditibacteriota bacterium]